MEAKYSARLTELFNETLFWSFLYDIVPPLTAYIESLSSVPNAQISENSFDDLIRVMVTALESTNYLVSQDQYNRPDMRCIDVAITCADVILKQNCLSSILALETHTSWLCSTINCICKLLHWFLLGNEPLPVVPPYGLALTLENVETASAGYACHQLSILLLWVQKGQSSHIPNVLLKRFKSIIVALARLPLCNSYLLTPPCAWKNGFNPKLTGTYNTQVPPLPIEFLQDVDVLEEFIFR